VGSTVSASAAPGPGAAGPIEVVEGVIDLAFREDDGGWVICDFKTDRVTGPYADRLALYRRQVDLYAACWERVTGERVKERVLFLTQDGQEVVW
jgi:ATP-dependent helicase/nuclease subunit A